MRINGEMFKKAKQFYTLQVYSTLTNNSSVTYSSRENFPMTFLTTQLNKWSDMKTPKDANKSKKILLEDRKNGQQVSSRSLIRKTKGFRSWKKNRQRKESRSCWRSRRSSRNYWRNRRNRWNKEKGNRTTLGEKEEAKKKSKCTMRTLKKTLPKQIWTPCKAPSSHRVEEVEEECRNQWSSHQ